MDGKKKSSRAVLFGDLAMQFALKFLLSSSSSFYFEAIFASNAFISLKAMLDFVMFLSPSSCYKYLYKL